MCGIFGLINLHNRNSIPYALQGLLRLEYRGYDSAGLAYKQGSNFVTLKSKGKIAALRAKIDQANPHGSICIAHTRWATHGTPSDVNAHPHASKNFCVVMNGIIENFKELKNMLRMLGYNFSSETDAEVIPYLLEHLYKENNHDVQAAVVQIYNLLQGRYAFVMINTANDDIYCIRHGAPLVIGKNKEVLAISSDTLPLFDIKCKTYTLCDNSIAMLQSSVGRPVVRYLFNPTPEAINFKHPDCGASLQGDKGDYEHFMLKEIEESSSVLGRILKTYSKNGYIDMNINLPLDKYLRIEIIGCGTSYHAGMVAKYHIEEELGIPCNVSIASEFRYKRFIATSETLHIFISQSGETADTLAALEKVRESSEHTLALVNVPTSSIAKGAKNIINLLAGPEIGVASTKAFLAQVACLTLLMMQIARAHGIMSAARSLDLLEAMELLPAQIDHIVHDMNFKDLAHKLSDASLLLFTGRGVCYPLALEGALKFKEITYRFAEGIAAGELKHGTIALIDEEVYVLALNPPNTLQPKTLSNVHEVKTRNAKVVMFANKAGLLDNEDIFDYAVELPNCNPLFIPLLYCLPLQLIAYHTAHSLGLDIDQPRNLAKSVTVE